MSDAPPQLGDIPRTSDFHIPQVPVADSIEPSDKPVSASSGPATMSTSNETNVAASVESAKNTVVSTAQSAMETVANHPITQNVTDTIANHPITQNVKETVTNGPVAQNVKEQASKTSAEASKLAESRKVPDTTAATGQPLTHYHSFFYNLLTWEHPRVTAISYISIITSIFILRYVPVLRITFKILAYALGTTALVEGLSQAVFAQSILAAFRPKKYFVLPRETLESTLEDVEQLLNFFVIESQRLLFAEDASKTAAAFLASLIGYWLIKFTPLWGLSLIAVTTIYFIPLIYILNKELIDEQLAHASKIVNAQTAQMKDLAAQHTAQATESLKVYAGDLSNQASEYIGSARRSISPAAHRAADTVKGVTDKAAETVKGVTEKDFPTAPKQEPIPSVGVTTTADQVDDEATKIATGVPAS